METITIVRKGNGALEQSVEVHRRGSRQKIDPQIAIKHATGVLLDRNYSIVSMALGFHNAGLHVIIERRSATAHWREAFKPKARSYIPIYHLFGLAHARGEWGQLTVSLERYVVPASRYTVLEATADYYWTKRFLVDPIRLQLP